MLHGRSLARPRARATASRSPFSDRWCELRSSEKAVPSPCLATELVAAQACFRAAGRQDLCDWAARELAGYPERGRVPPYRMVPAIARGSVRAGESVLDDHPLPVWHLAGDWSHEAMRQGLAQLETLARGGAPRLRQAIHPDTHALFTRGLRLGGGHVVTRAWWEIRTEDLSSVLLAGAREALHDALRTLNVPCGGPVGGDR